MRYVIFYHERVGGVKSETCETIGSIGMFALKRAFGGTKVALFGTKKQEQIEREQFVAKVHKIADDCQTRVRNFPGMMIQDVAYSASNLMDDVAHLVYASAELGDDAILWWVTKVTALITDSGVEIPVHDIAKNLLWCKSMARDSVERYKDKGQHVLLTRINNVDQAWWATMQQNPRLEEAAEYLRLHLKELSAELNIST